MLIKRNTREQIVADRGRALRLLREGLALLREADAACRCAGMPDYGWFAGLSHTDWTDLGADGKADRLIEKLRARMDARIWAHLLEVSGLRALMDAEEVDRFRAQLDEAPPVTDEAIVATFQHLLENRHNTFRRGLVNVFRGLSSKYRSNRPFEIGPRIVLRDVLSEWGWDTWARGQEKIADLDRIFHLLDNRPAPKPYRDAAQAVYEARRNGRGEVQTDYFRFRLYGNGNVHVYFLRDDLRQAANRLIAEHYGETLAHDRRVGKTAGVSPA